MGISLLSKGAVAVGVLALAACARVSVRKVGEDGQLVGPSGIPVYRNRPYLVVNEPFVVGAKPYIARGEVSPDGRYLLIDEVASLPQTCREALGISGVFLSSKTPAAAVEASRVIVGLARPEARPEAVPPSPPVPTAAPTSTANQDATPVSPVTSEETGQLNLKVTNDNSAFAMTRLKRYFDVLYLPDFDEDYRVEGASGLGNASVSVALGQGWSLEGLDASVDNGPIAKRLLNLMDQGAALLTSLSPAAAAAIPSTLAGTPKTPATGPEAVTLKDGVLTGDFKGGTPVSVKVTLVRIVAPGAYKFLKPKELAEFGLIHDRPCSPCGSTCNLDFFESRFGDRILLPVPPFTDIALNTYTVAVIEAAQPFGDSALKPAVAAPAASPESMRRSVPVIAAKPEAVPPPAVDEAVRRLEAAQSAANDRLLRARCATGPYWTVRLTLDPAGSGVTASLLLIGEAMGAASVDLDTAREVVREEVAAAGLGPTQFLSR